MALVNLLWVILLWAEALDCRSPFLHQVFRDSVILYEGIFTSANFQAPAARLQLSLTNSRPGSFHKYLHNTKPAVPWERREADSQSPRKRRELNPDFPHPMWFPNKWARRLVPMQEMEHEGVFSQAYFWVLTLRACYLLSGESWTLESDGEHWKTGCCSQLSSEKEHIVKNSSALAPAAHKLP